MRERDMYESTGARGRCLPSGSSAIFRSSFVCPYFHDDRTASVEFLVPSEEDLKNFHFYLARGYRRQERYIYRNCCSGCSSCIPIRLRPEQFSPGKGQRRTLRDNEDLKVTVLYTPEVTEDKVCLYERYQQKKHGRSNEGSSIETEEALNMLHNGFGQTIEINYHIGKLLIGVGIIDLGRDAVSSNYFYYDTDFPARRLGVFSIMQEILLAQRLRKQYYYLGFYIEENKKMSYKKFFRPNEILTGRWTEFFKKPCA
jgi:leucyl-tRNA---protein transferase